MAAAAGKDTVWIGFMDIVPVIGTVKEAVELVLAVYNGNKAVVKEKEKAIENIVKESLRKHVKLTEAPAAAAFFGKETVMEIRKEMIAEHVKKGTKRRGEHVFNNDILRFHLKVLTEFIQSQNIGYDQQAINRLGQHTLSQNTATEIQTNMVVHFGEDEFYVNANAVVYGEYCRALRGVLLDVLRHINPDDVTEENRRRVNFVIGHMNNLQIYVDEIARDKWINNIQTRRDRCENVRQEVANMYRTDRGLDWCIGVLVEVAPLFGPRS